MKIGNANKPMEILLAEMEDKSLYTWSKLTNDFGEEAPTEAITNGYIKATKNSIGETVYKITGKGLAELRKDI